MKKIITFSLIGLVSIGLTQCKKNDEEEKLRDYSEVYTENIDAIENYLKTHKVTINGFNQASFDEVSEGNNSSIWNQTQYPLQHIVVKNDSRKSNSTEGASDDQVEYKLYYMIINEGGGSNVASYDNLYTAYSAYNIQNTLFDKNNIGFWSSFPKYGNEASYAELISGFRQAATLVKTASTITTNPDGTFNADDAGRVIVFIPSGLGYFNRGFSKLGKYQPAIFDITLLAKNEVDHDEDGLLTKYEVNPDGGSIFTYDTDGDKKPNFLDVDDDADGALTKKEITYQTQNPQGETVEEVYSFDAIPSCTAGGPKKHLDPNCQ